MSKRIDLVADARRAKLGAKLQAAVATWFKTDAAFDWEGNDAATNEIERLEKELADLGVKGPADLHLDFGGYYGSQRKAWRVADERC
ncbi:MAG: hypothetical protein ACOY3L_14345 [Pseudomonadota bacterium]